MNLCRKYLISIVAFPCLPSRNEYEWLFSPPTLSHQDHHPSTLHSHKFQNLDFNSNFQHGKENENHQLCILINFQQHQNGARCGYFSLEYDKCEKATQFESELILLEADDRGVFLEVNILVGAEVFCERYAGEVTAPIAVIDWGQVEDKNEHQEDEEGDAEAENHEHLSSGFRGC